VLEEKVLTDFQFVDSENLEGQIKENNILCQNKK